MRHRIIQFFANLFYLDLWIIGLLIFLKNNQKGKIVAMQVTNFGHLHATVYKTQEKQQLYQEPHLIEIEEIMEKYYCVKWKVFPSHLIETREITIGEFKGTTKITITLPALIAFAWIGAIFAIVSHYIK